MEAFLEILNAFAAIATIAGLWLEIWREYRHIRADDVVEKRKAS